MRHDGRHHGGWIVGNKVAQHGLQAHDRSGFQRGRNFFWRDRRDRKAIQVEALPDALRSEEHTSELQSLLRNSYAVFCLKPNNTSTTNNTPIITSISPISN